MAWFEHGPTRLCFEVAGRGDPVLLLPGFTDSIAAHGALRHHLAERFRVIAADLPGSGLSGPQPRHYGRHYYEEDAALFVEFLTEHTDRPAHLVGYSDGGEVALMMAALQPSVARSVFTWGAAGAVSDPDGQIVASFRTVVDDPVPGFGGFRDYLLASYGEVVARAMTQSFADAIHAIVADGGDICRDRADRITCPVCLLVGETDIFVTKPLIDALAARIANSETTEVPGAGHSIHEDKREWFTAKLLDWLARN